MADHFGKHFLTSASTTSSPYAITPIVPALHHAVISVFNDRNNGPVLAKASGSSAWAVVPPRAEFGLSVPSGETLQLAVQGPQYRSVSVHSSDAPAQIPYGVVVSLASLVAA